ncbi:collagenase, partial [Clostridium tarantellae]
MFLNELDKLTESSIKIDKDSEWLVNSFIYFTGRLSKFRINKNITKKVITNCTKRSEYLSSIYIECIKALRDNFNSEFSDGTSVEYDEKINKAKEKYLSETYKFDNGKIIIKTGNKVSKEKVKKLYWASKEVKAQFMRVIGNDIPLEKDNADDILNIVIYNSPQEYKMNQKLYGYSTENGGIYIEDIGTFFTYERTEQESIYTLEELFRHEFTHYLQGRYLVPGIWGKSDFYKNNSNKLTWYDEGTAEFFAGSTRERGVRPRKSVVKNLSKDKNERQSVKEILHAKYGSWEFYNYGFAFANYMYENNIEQFQTMNNFIKNNDVEGYTRYIEKLSSDIKINENYQRVMDKLVDNSNELTVPLVSNEYIKNHLSKNKNDICQEVQKIIKIENVKINEEKSDFFDTFTLKGKYIGKSKDNISHWKDMNNILDNTLKKLDENSWSGYKTVTAYFTNYKVDDNGQYSFDVTFHGILRTNKTEKIEKSEKIENLSNDDKKIKEVKENNLLKVNKNMEGYLSKDNPSYTYCFEVDKEGKININFENPDNLKLTWHVKKDDKYIAWGADSLKNNFDAIPGKYLLTVYDYTSKDANGNFKILMDGFLREEEKGKGIEEFQYNNDFQHAVSIKNNVLLEGTLNDDNNNDFFKFNIKNNSKVNITVDTLGEEGVAWILYNSNDLSKYVLASINKNGLLQNTCEISPGEYYLSVYK